MRFPLKRAAGFTLIEVLVVVVILAILAAVVVPKVMEHPGEARQARAKADVQAVVTALNTYKLDNFTYPSNEQGLVALVAKPAGSPEAPNWKKGGYLDRVPKDPWGREYLYLRPGAHERHQRQRVERPGDDGERVQRPARQRELGSGAPAAAAAARGSEARARRRRHRGARRRQAHAEVI